MSARVKSEKSDRPKYATRSLVLRSEAIRESALAAIRNAPIDTLRPLEILVREEVKARKLDQNAAMWAGPLKDIAEQGWLDGRQFAIEVWHEHFKERYLPEEFNAEDCKEGYVKWSYTPNGRRVLVGSTTHLTVSGFAKYLREVEAFGATELGVRFNVNPRDERWMA